VTPDVVGARPLPEISPLTEPFWAAARERRLVIQRCASCAVYRFPPELGCFQCGSLESLWEPVSGRATLFTWTVAHPPLLPYFRERAPWAVAIVQLEEGPRLVTNIIGVPPEDYEIGMPLQADFEDIDDRITLVVFRRAGPG
jgi:uncharacterized OB-fold protein